MSIASELDFSLILSSSSSFSSNFSLTHFLINNILKELLFSETLPSFVQPPTNDDNNYSGNMLPLQQLIHKSLTQILDVDLRKELSSNIILTGGVSLFPTMDKRLSVELGEVLPSSYKYKVIGSKNSVENRYSAWIGGSILSSLGSFQQVRSNL